MAELKQIEKCPFCGHEKTYIFTDIDSQFGESFANVCDKCGATGPFEDSKEQAIDAWNKRS